MKKIFLFLILLVCFFMSAYMTQVKAEYVLPYPSFMPGNKLYTVSRIIDKVKKYWYFGNIAQLKYHMMLSDKYLVEAKTLFEYKQYTLALQALINSTKQIAAVPQNIQDAQKKGVDMNSFRQNVCDQMGIHQTVLKKLKSELPDTFVWQDEKKPAIDLSILENLESSLITRDSISKEICL